MVAVLKFSPPFFFFFLFNTLFRRCFLFVSFRLPLLPFLPTLRPHLNFQSQFSFRRSFPGAFNLNLYLPLINFILFFFCTPGSHYQQLSAAFLRSVGGTIPATTRLEQTDTGVRYRLLTFDSVASHCC